VTVAGKQPPLGGETGGLGRRSPNGSCLLRTPVEVVIELSEVISSTRGNQTHDVISEQGHQGGHDRQVRALLSEVLCSTIPAAYGIPITVRELFRYGKPSPDLHDGVGGGQQLHLRLIATLVPRHRIARYALTAAQPVPGRHMARRSSRLPREEALDSSDTCSLCGTRRSAAELVSWFIAGGRRPVHTECWIKAYERTRSAGRNVLGPDDLHRR
jgi:hypothetical protein